MDKEMMEVEVYTQEGAVIIEQSLPFYNGSDVIMLSPDQIDVVITWLQEAKEELSG